jgi:hypothetical protein
MQYLFVQIYSTKQCRTKIHLHMRKILLGLGMYY